VKLAWESYLLGIGYADTRDKGTLGVLGVLAVIFFFTLEPKPRDFESRN
jgi:hypothetical protein